MNMKKKEKQILVQPYDVPFERISSCTKFLLDPLLEMGISEDIKKLSRYRVRVRFIGLLSYQVIALRVHTLSTIRSNETPYCYTYIPIAIFVARTWFTQ